MLALVVCSSHQVHLSGPSRLCLRVAVCSYIFGCWNFEDSTLSYGFSIEKCCFWFMQIGYTCISLLSGPPDFVRGLNPWLLEFWVNVVKHFCLDGLWFSVPSVILGTYIFGFLAPVVRLPSLYV